MNFEIISERAFKKQPLGEFPNIADKYAYLQLLNLYKDYENQNITKAKAVQEKAKIKKEFEVETRNIELDLEMRRTLNQIRGNYGLWIANIEKSKNQDEQLEYCLKFIEAILQDNSFVNRNLEKFD